jgi:hypothetical protein
MTASDGPAPGDRPAYSISAVARMLDVPVATSRTWEDRYGQVVPAHNASGHRLFARYQFEKYFLRKPLDPLQLVSWVRDLLRSSALLAR